MGRFRAAWVLVLSVLAWAGAARAGEAPPAAAGPEVTAVLPVKARLGQKIALVVEGLKGGEFGGAKPVLFLRGEPMIDVVPLYFDKGAHRYVFRLERNGASEGSKAAWAAVLANPIAFEREVPVSLGTLADGPLPSQASLKLEVIPLDWYTYAGLALYAFALGLFLYALQRSDIVRDSGPAPPPPKRRPYSLGRCQMAFWFFVITGSFLLIWILTQDRDVIPPSALVLMGIASGTALGAVTIDATKRGTAQSDLDAAAAAATALQHAVADLKTKVDAATAAQPPVSPETLATWGGELTSKQRDLEAAARKVDELKTKAEPAASAGPWKDLLSEGDGIALHRFQMLVWTLVLGVVFLATVGYNLTMPNFKEVSLGLLGISGLTYLGFKFPTA